MYRVLRGTPETITATFSLDGIDTDPTPDTATVHITRDDGTDVVAAGTAAVAGVGDGEFTFLLTAAMTASLDVLTVTWTSTNLGTITQTVEVVGGFLFSLAQARAIDPLSDTDRFTTQQLVDARTLVETAIEDACGVAFVPRYRRESLSGEGRTQMMLGMPRITAIRSLALDGVAVSDLSTVAPSGVGTIYYPGRFTRGFGNYDIAYEHGWPTPPPRITQAALRWARSLLIDGPIDDRYTSVSNDVGTFSLATPGLRGSVSGIPEVDATIAEYSLRACIA